MGRCCGRRHCVCTTLDYYSKTGTACQLFGTKFLQGKGFDRKSPVTNRGRFGKMGPMAERGCARERGTDGYPDAPGGGGDPRAHAREDGDRDAGGSAAALSARLYRPFGALRHPGRAARPAVRGARHGDQKVGGDPHARRAQDVQGDRRGRQRRNGTDLLQHEVCGGIARLRRGLPLLRAGGGQPPAPGDARAPDFPAACRPALLRGLPADGGRLRPDFFGAGGAGAEALAHPARTDPGGHQGRIPPGGNLRGGARHPPPAKFRRARNSQAEAHL